MTKPKKYIFKNGLTLVVVPMGDVPTVTALVLVGTGSDYEKKEVNGISHFLEHMCFKGTAKRPSAQAISHELDALGSQYNAFTDHELTGYYAKADAKKFKKIFEIISDIYLNSTFPEGEIEKEKGVIVEEINMYEDMPQRHVQDIFAELLYGDQPAGRNIAGTKENVRRMTRDDFVKYKNAHYLPSATTIVIAGSVSFNEALVEARKHFGGMKHGLKSKKIKTKDTQKSPQVLISSKKTDQTHFVLGVRTFDLFSKKNTVLSVLGGVLGAGMSSRLFIKLREDMGAAYYVNAYNNTSLDHGVFQISAGVTNDRTKEVITEILKECKKLKDELVPEVELEKVKSMLVGNMKLSLEATDDIANFYGIQELLKGEMKTIEEKAREIEKVTSKDIQKIAREIFTKKHLNLTLIGPHSEKAGFIKILTI
jgi:predicted Zn-dependent peptidase